MYIICISHASRPQLAAFGFQCLNPSCQRSGVSHAAVLGLLNDLKIYIYSIILYKYDFFYNYTFSSISLFLNFYAFPAIINDFFYIYFFPHSLWLSISYQSLQAVFELNQKIFRSDKQTDPAEIGGGGLEHDLCILFMYM